MDAVGSVSCCNSLATITPITINSMVDNNLDCRRLSISVIDGCGAVSRSHHLKAKRACVVVFIECDLHSIHALLYGAFVATNSAESPTSITDSRLSQLEYSLLLSRYLLQNGGN